MAKLSSINKNERRKKLVKKYAGKYAKLKAIADDESLDDGGERRGEQSQNQERSPKPERHIIPPLEVRM